MTAIPSTLINPWVDLYKTNASLEKRNEEDKEFENKYGLYKPPPIEGRPDLMRNFMEIGRNLPKAPEGLQVSPLHKGLEQDIDTASKQDIPDFSGVLPPWWDEEEQRIAKALTQAPAESQKALGRKLYIHRLEKKLEQERRLEKKKEFEASGATPQGFAEKEFLKKNGYELSWTGPALSIIETVMDRVVGDNAAWMARAAGMSEIANELYSSMDRRAAVRAVSNKYYDAAAKAVSGSSLYSDDIQNIAGSFSRFAATAPGGFYTVVGDAVATTFSRALYDGDQAGLQGQDKYMYAGYQAAIEGGLTLLAGKTGLESLAGKNALAGFINKGWKDYIKRTGFMVAQELPEEVGIEVLQNVVDHIYGLDEMTPEKVARTLKSVLVTTIGTVGLARGLQDIAIPRAPQQDFTLIGGVQGPPPRQAKVRPEAATEPEAEGTQAQLPVTAPPIVINVDAAKTGFEMGPPRRQKGPLPGIEGQGRGIVPGFRQKKGPLPGIEGPDPSSPEPEVVPEPEQLAGPEPEEHPAEFHEGTQEFFNQDPQRLQRRLDKLRKERPGKARFERLTRILNTNRADREKIYDRIEEVYQAEKLLARAKEAYEKQEKEKEAARVVAVQTKSVREAETRTGNGTDPWHPDNGPVGRFDPIEVGQGAKFTEQPVAPEPEPVETAAEPVAPPKKSPEAMGFIPPGLGPHVDPNEDLYINPEHKERVRATWNPDETLYERFVRLAKAPFKFFMPLSELGFRSKSFGKPHLEHFRHALLQNANVPQWAQEQTEHELSQVVAPMEGDKYRFEIFENVLMNRDQLEGYKDGNKLAYGFKDINDVLDALQRSEAKASQDPKIMEALKRRARMLARVQQAKIDRGMAQPDSMHANYFHREIREHYKAARFSHKLKGGPDRSRIQRQQKGGRYSEDQDPIINYLIAESSWLGESVANIRKHDLLQDSWMRYSETHKAEIDQYMADNGVDLDEAMKALGMDEYIVSINSHLSPREVLKDRFLQELKKAAPNDDLTAIFKKMGFDPDKHIRTITQWGLSVDRMYLPKEVVRQLEKADRDATNQSVADNIAIRAAAEGSAYWKAWILHNPAAITLYEGRNTFGDFQKFSSSLPLKAQSPIAAAKEFIDVGKQIIAYTRDAANMSPLIEAAIDNGVWGSSNIAELKSGHLPKSLQGFLPRNNAVKAYFQWTAKWGSARESYLRLVYFNRVREAMAKGNLYDYAASPKHAIQDLRKNEGVDAAAAQMTKDLFVDYTNTSDGGKWMSNALIGFYRFAAGNAKAWPRLEYNATIGSWQEVFKQGKIKGSNDFTAHAKAAMLTASLLARRHKITAMVLAWNILRAGDDWDEVKDLIPPGAIYLGKRDDGQLRLVRNLDTLQEVGEWLGVHEIIRWLPNYQEGSITLKDMLYAPTEAIWEKFKNSITPFPVGAAVELTMGAELETTRPRARGDLLAGYVGMADAKRQIEGMVLENGARARGAENHKLFDFFQRRMSGLLDPRSESLWRTHELIDKWRETNGMKKYLSGESVWAPVRAALHEEDYNAWKEAVAYRTKNGSSRKAYFSYIKALDPVSRIPKRDRASFLEFLTPRQREHIDIAEKTASEYKALGYEYAYRARKEGFEF